MNTLHPQAFKAAQAFGAGLVPVPEEDPRFVLREWIGARNVDVTEDETAALMAQAEAPQFLHMNLRGQLLHTARSMWAYRALAKMRGEYWPADDVTGIERADGNTAAMGARAS